MKKFFCRAFIFVMLFSTILGSFSIGAFAEEEKSYTIDDFWFTDKQIKAIRTDTAPTIDGSGSDAVWQNATSVTYIGPDGDWKGGTNWVAGDSATIKFLWDDTALYILDIRVDSDIVTTGDGIEPVYGTTNQGGVPWNTQGAIFGLEPIDSLPYETKSFQFYETLIDPNGGTTGGIRMRIFEHGSSNTYCDTPDAIEYKAALTTSGWEMETKVPWSIIREYYPEFNVTAGTFMGLRLTIYNSLTTSKGSVATGYYTQYGNKDYGGNVGMQFPVLALADASGNVPDIDRLITGGIGDFSEDISEENPVVYEQDESGNIVQATENTQAVADTEAEQTEDDGANVVLIVILSVVCVLAVAGAVVVFIFLKKQVIRIIAIALATVIVLGCVIGMVSSGNNRSASAEETTATTVSTRDGEEEITSNVPADLTFGGSEVNILIREARVAEFNPEYSGAIIDNAIYERNQYVEDRLAVELNYIPNKSAEGTDYISHVRTTIMSGATGDEAYDIITTFAYFGAALAIEGLYYDLNTDDENNYINTSSRWYNQSFVEENTYNGHLYFSVGDANLSATDRIVVTFVNKKALTTYELGTISDLYTLALAGGWTLEYVYNMTKGIYEDLNRNGKDTNDFYGLSFNNGSMCVDAMFAGLNVRSIGRDANGELKWTLYTQRNSNAYAALHDFIYSGADGIRLNQPGASEYNGTTLSYMSDQMFYEGRCVLDFGLLESSKTFSGSEAELDYGIMPLPKYDTNQLGYYTTPQDSYSLISLPMNIGSRTQIATATLEILSEESYRTVRPAYYETAYKVRYASNEDSALLFDMIVDNITYNFGTVYSSSLNDPVWQLRNNLIGYANKPVVPELSTIWATHKSTFNSSLNKLIAQMK